MKHTRVQVLMPPVQRGRHGNVTGRTWTGQKSECLTLLTALLLAPLAVLHAAGAPAKPNTVFILSDDQGASDCGFMSHPHIQRLHLDWLAARGMRFWESCCTHPLCCPSRGSPLISRMPHEWGS